MSFRKSVSTIPARTTAAHGQSDPIAGTKRAASGALPPHHCYLSTGIPSLDDVLGSGVQSGCLLAICIEDDDDTESISAIGRLILRHWIVQSCQAGASVGRVMVISGPLERKCFAEDICHNLPLRPSRKTSVPPPANDTNRMQIAWRYQDLSPFKTSLTDRVPPRLQAKMNLAAKSQSPSEEHGVRPEYCFIPDLSVPATPAEVEELQKAGVLLRLCMDAGDHTNRMLEVRKHLQDTVPKTTRLAFEDFGSTCWQSVSPLASYNFTREVRALLRSQTDRIAAALFTIPSHLFKNNAGQRSHLQRLLHNFDYVIGLHPIKSQAPLGHDKACQCALTIDRLNVPCAISPLSARQSVLLGLNSGQGWSNDLGVHISRRRLTIETRNLEDDRRLRDLPDKQALPTQTAETINSTGYDPAKRKDYDF